MLATSDRQAMARLLHIEASPRGDRSYSTRVARRFVEHYLAAHPGDELEHLPLFEADLPEFGREAALAKMAQIDNLVAGGRGIPPEGPWAGVHREVNRLKAVDKVLISSPMWNYSIPYKLKHYIDIVCQPGVSFYVNREGRYVGMVRNKPPSFPRLRWWVAWSTEPVVRNSRLLKKAWLSRWYSMAASASAANTASPTP